MEYKKFSNAAKVEDVFERVETRDYSSKASMFNMLVQIKSEWRGTFYAEKAERLIESEFSEFNVYNEQQNFKRWRKPPLLL